ncbi:MAG: phosphate ABC transporter substrate-binding protein PstS [Bacteroidales bacterium]|nr:phosphate ABC transporter substrate-binding protein PstS [Bacteroidales bacterium]
MKKILVLLVAVALIASCKNSGQKTADESKKVTLTAAGATFPMPFYNQVFKNYTEETGILLTYGGIGSGGGIRSLKDKVVDFGATDAYLEDDKIGEMPAEIVHIPTCLGAVVIAYNLDNVEGLKLTPELLEGIFLGEITKWDDPKMKANNPEITLPDMNITVMHRSDGSGTTHIFSDYMCKVSPKWEEKVGRGKALEWPVGIGSKGNPGVAGAIQQTKGSIGYIGSEYALAQSIPMVQLMNKAGKYIAPTVESISAAAKGELPADTRVMLTNPDFEDAYPISGFTWIILYKEQAYDGRSEAQALETVKFLDWLISADAQAVTSQVNYSPLPEEMVANAKKILRSITYDGKALLQ